MKKKANGTHHHAIDVARGYEQIKGIHYEGASFATPVTNGMSIRIILALMADWASKIVDVKGAFLWILISVSTFNVYSKKLMNSIPLI